MLYSLWDNNIGDQGAIALAAILKETKITDLKCALCGLEPAPDCVRKCVNTH